MKTTTRHHLLYGAMLALLFLLTPAASQAQEAPYGDTAIYLRGEPLVGTWDALEENRLQHVEGTSLYRITLALTSGGEFKVADASWGVVNIGAGASSVTPNQDGAVLSRGANPGNVLANIQATEESFEYVFTLDASNPDAPVLSIEGGPPPFVPDFFVRIHYFRQDGRSSEFGLHLFNVAADPLDPREETTWPVTKPFSNPGDFGAYADVGLTADGGTFGFVVHRNATERDMEVNVDLAELTPLAAADEPGPHYEIWLVQGIVAAFTDFADAEEATTRVTQETARWLSREAIAWNHGRGDVASYAFYYHPAGDIFFDSAAGTMQIGLEGDERGGMVPLPAADSTIGGATVAAYPFVEGWPILDATGIENHEEILKGHVVVAAFDADGRAVAATSLQRHGIYDDLYAYDGELGLTWDNGVPTLRLWSPPARSVAVRVFRRWHTATEVPGSPFPMQPVMDGERWTGVWEVTGSPDWNNYFYRYDVEVFVPSAQDVLEHEVTDPYSISLSVSSAFSHIANPDDPSLKPEGWDALAKPGMAPEDIVIYELHVRDFSISDETVPSAERGTFRAFAPHNAETNGMRHLRALGDAGLTHIHFIPINDIATINEQSDKLRQFWPNPTGFAPNSDEQQAIIRENAGDDGFNWGYDPFHYFVPEGSYSTDPNGSARIRELREAVLGLHQAGLRVVQDVVFNHTNSAGQFSVTSVLDKVVPGYYYRLTHGGAVHTDVCCPELMTENYMTQKLMVDAMTHWARVYKIDAFRYDLMGDHTVTNIQEVRQSLATLNLEDDGVDGANIYIYGEPWMFGSLLAYRPGESMNQQNMQGSGVGGFNDRFRDQLGHKFGYGWIDSNFGTNPVRSNRVRHSLMANLSGVDQVSYSSDAAIAFDPQEAIQHITVHDNYTLFDELAMRHLPAGASLESVLTRHRFALAHVMFAQGVPFFHAGVDMLRSKSGDRNTYDSGDWFNRLDFTYQDNNWARGLPPLNDTDNNNNRGLLEGILTEANVPSPEQIQRSVQHFRELLQIRRSSALFRMQDAPAIRRNVRFLNRGQQTQNSLIAYSLTDSGSGLDDLDPQREWVLVLFNASDSASQTFRHDALRPSDSDMRLHAVLRDSVVSEIRQAQEFPTSDGSILVPPLTALVYEGTRLPAFALDAGPSLGFPVAEPLYLRGTFNDFAVEETMRLQPLANAVYALTADLPAGRHTFKIGDASWTAGTNFGAGLIDLVVPGVSLRTVDMGRDFVLNLPRAGTFRFLLDLSLRAGAGFARHDLLTVQEVSPVAWMPDARPVAGGWLSSQRFGWFFPVGDTDWIYHLEHGWQFTRPSGDGVLLYDENLTRWMWTTPLIYPWIYIYGADEGWYFYFPNARPGTRSFYRAADGSTIGEDQFGG